MKYSKYQCKWRTAAVTFPSGRALGASHMDAAAYFSPVVAPLAPYAAPALYQYYDADRFTVLITEELGQSGV